MLYNHQTIHTWKKDNLNKNMHSKESWNFRMQFKFQTNEPIRKSYEILTIQFWL